MGAYSPETIASRSTVVRSVRGAVVVPMAVILGTHGDERAEPRERAVGHPPGSVEVVEQFAGAVKVDENAMTSVEGLFDLKGFPSAHSDVVAQMVLAHQTRMTNIITRTGWEARLAEERTQIETQLADSPDWQRRWARFWRSEC